MEVGIFTSLDLAKGQVLMCLKLATLHAELILCKIIVYLTQGWMGNVGSGLLQLSCSKPSQTHLNRLINVFTVTKAIQLKLLLFFFKSGLEELNSA